MRRHIWVKIKTYILNTNNSKKTTLQLIKYCQYLKNKIMPVIFTYSKHIFYIAVRQTFQTQRVHQRTNSISYMYKNHIRVPSWHDTGSLPHIWNLFTAYMYGSVPFQHFPIHHILPQNLKSRQGLYRLDFWYQNLSRLFSI